MRLLYAIALVVLALRLAALLVWVRPLWAETTRCTTYEERTLGRLQTVCDDGTRAVSTWNRTLERWDTTVTSPSGQADTAPPHPRRRPWKGRAR